MSDEEIERTAFEATERGDYDAAVRLLEPLAENDSPYALTTLGWIYQNGPESLLDRELACKYYERAIALGSADANLQMGWFLLSEGKFTEARAVLEDGKEKDGGNLDDALDAVNIAETEFAAFEAIESKNYKKALELLEKQKERDSEYTLISLGWLYETGRAGTTDKDEAGALYRRAAQIGCVDAYFRIGSLELSRGNDEVARTEFEVGANLGHLPAMTKLGKMMIDGKGGPTDVEQGMNLLRSAAQQGHIMARIELGFIKEKAEKNILKRALLKFKYFGIIWSAIKEAKKEGRSPNIYEFY